MIQRRISAIVAIVLVICPVAYGQRVVSGTVTDANTGEALPGVTVSIEGTSEGTITDLEGKYSISLPSSEVVLVFRFVGYRSQTLQPDPGSGTLSVRLRESVLGLDEIVVVGTRRLPRLVKDSVVPVDVLGPSDFSNAATTDMDDMLRTHVPSYNVRQSGGDEAALVRPATLRGLPTDNIVVLAAA